MPKVDYAEWLHVPNHQALEDLDEISMDSRNVVIIYSVQSKETLEEIFRDLEDVWLVAESGYKIRPGGQREWHRLMDF